MIKRIKNILVHVLTFTKPECENVLHPEPRSGEGCNTISHGGLANVNTENNVISSLLYTFLSSTPGLNGKPSASVY